jgi:hypothetical protein
MGRLFCSKAQGAPCPRCYFVTRDPSLGNGETFSLKSARGSMPAKLLRHSRPLARKWGDFFAQKRKGLRARDITSSLATPRQEMGRLFRSKAQGAPCPRSYFVTRDPSPRKLSLRNRHLGSHHIKAIRQNDESEFLLRTWRFNFYNQTHSQKFLEYYLPLRAYKTARRLIIPASKKIHDPRI